MQSFRENLAPFFIKYNDWLNGFYLSDLLEFKGGSSVGNDYVSKVLLSQQQERLTPYKQTLQAIRNPSLLGFFSDNWLRLVGFHAFERLIAAYQVLPVTKFLQQTPNTMGAVFTKITNEGIFRGSFKGFSPALLQFCSVLYPSVYLARNAQTETGKWTKFLSTYLILDTLLYPLDTIKGILYGDIGGTTNLRRIVQDGYTEYWSLYRGYMSRLIFNIPYASALYFTSQKGSEFEASISWLATFLLYPLQNYKIISQVAGSDYASVMNIKKATDSISFRGIIPFFLLNIGLCWNLRPLFNESSLQQFRNINIQYARKTVQNSSY